MIEFMYTTEYASRPKTEEYSRHPEQDFEWDTFCAKTLCIEVEMYAIADKYAIPLLKEKAAKKFQVCLAMFTVPSKFPHVPQAVTINHVIKVIPIVYSSTPDTDRRLRDMVVKYAIKFWDDIEQCTDIQELILANPSFIADVLRKMKSGSEKFFGYSRFAK